MRFIIDHWPEFFALALYAVGACAVMLLPLNIWARIGLVPVGVAAGFIVWAAVSSLGIWLIWPRKF
jgi:hypothetical protein